MLAADTSEPGPGTDMAIALRAMFAQMERIYILERAVGARAAKEARGLPTGRPAKLNATTRAGAAQRIKDGAIPEQVAAEFGVSRSTVYRELRRHRESTSHEV
ncbi:helix-turn-helix domain-containing protein [Streptomyces mirabilis]|uniref:helix-turn-helix domain-containing protein n=1 Tax=Streptomyces mirabilis TaxID=68239 RepID=UPI0036538931